VAWVPTGVLPVWGFFFFFFFVAAFILEYDKRRAVSTKAVRPCGGEHFEWGRV